MFDFETRDQFGFTIQLNRCAMNMDESICQHVHFSLSVELSYVDEYCCTRVC
jgi:hypothetical protein